MDKGPKGIHSEEYVASIPNRILQTAIHTMYFASREHDLLGGSEMSITSRMMKHASVAGILALSGLVCVMPAQASGQFGKVASFQGGYWQPNVGYDQAKLTVTGPRDFVLEKRFSAHESIAISGSGMPDGQYSYELRLMSNVQSGESLQMQTVAASEVDKNGRGKDASQRQGDATLRLQTGYFRVNSGSIVTPSPGTEEQ